MALERLSHRRYRCRSCGVVFNALPVTQAPDGALLLIHLASRHCAALRPLLARMAAGEDIATVAAEAYAMLGAVLARGHGPSEGDAGVA
jgi:hypothetical protein